MSYFAGVNSSGSGAETQALEKALSAGYGTDSATFINGRAMIPEDLESTVVSVTSMMENDCKMFNSLKKEPAHSTIHEYNRRTSHGDHRFLSVPEGGASGETDQALSRAFVEMKYLQTLRQVTKQMEVVKTFEGALASEKISGVQTIVKGTEHQIFHGDSRVVPTEFDGLLATLGREDSRAVKKDLRGKSLGSVGESLFDEVAQNVFDIDNNGELTKALFPPVLASDIKGLFTDRLRMLMNDSVLSFKGLPAYGTAIGHDIRFSGKDAGADKYFHVKGKVVAAGDPTKRPEAPKTFTAAPGSKDGSEFVTADAGTYMYTVHAVNAFGISAAKAIDAPASVTAGQGVTLTITPADNGAAATGYIICRSKKDGTETMEMVQIGAKTGAPTEYVDLNKDLPGTASMLFLSDGMYGSPTMQFDQLLPVQSIPMYPTNQAVTPFLVVLYGALQVNAPEHCALVKNIQYRGGF